MNSDSLHKLLSRRSTLLDAIGRVALRFYLYRENAYFNPEHNGEHNLLNVLKSKGFVPRIIFDIGANEGRWSAKVGEMWPQADVHMFEPMPAIAQRLMLRFADRDRFQVHAVAVGGEDGKVELHANTEITSHSFVKKSGETEGGAQIVSGVKALSLSGCGHVDLCKIDAEGFDLAILRSFAPLLAAHKIHVIQFEHHCLAVAYDEPFTAIARMLRENGYRLGKIFPEGLREVVYDEASWSHQIGPNFCAISPKSSIHFDSLVSRPA